MIKQLNNAPLISVVMSVYNSEKYLADAIEGVLNQTYRNFEFIIVNDGSQDNSLDIIQQYQNKDNRIILIDRENKGLPYSLNEGISIARGEYIARMDADDICLSERFEKQLQYMQEHNLDICGSFVEAFDNNSTQQYSYPINDADIKFTLLFYCCLAHPSVLIRKKVFDKIQYNINYKQAQDYQLWVDAAKEQFIFGNIPEFLLRYRVHNEQMTISKSKSQQNFAVESRTSYSLYLGKDAIELANKIGYMNGSCNHRIFKSVLKDTLELSQNRMLSEKTLFSILKYLYNIANPKSPYLYFIYKDFSKEYQKNIKEELVLFMKSFLFFKKDSFLYSLIKKMIN